MWQAGAVIARAAGRLAQGLLVSMLLVATAHADSRETKSPAVAAGLSIPPTLVGLGLATVGLFVANIDVTCSGDPSVPPGVTCSEDYFDLGLGLTIAGGAVLAVGPSLGHIYAGKPWSTGLKVRLAGVAASALGLGAVLLDPNDCGDVVCPVSVIGLLVVMAGGATFVVGAGIDAVRAADAARDSGVQLTLVPLRTPRGSSPGIALQMRF